MPEKWLIIVNGNIPQGKEFQRVFEGKGPWDNALYKKFQKALEETGGKIQLFYDHPETIYQLGKRELVSRIASFHPIRS